MDTNSLATVKQLLDKANELLVVTHENPTFDSIGSSLALSLGLISLGKTVTVACPDPMTVELANFIGANKVKQELGNKNFVISLDYVDGSIEKVSYNIEGSTFNLVVEHRPGFEPFSVDKVHYSYSGVSADVIFIVDTIHLGGLGKLYEGQKELFAGKPVVNIDWHPNNSQYGQVNLLNSKSSSTSELVAQLLSSLDIRFTPDIATNLLNAIYSATNTFQSQNVSAFAFELAGAAIKAGGKRFGGMATATTPGLTGLVPKVQEAKQKVHVQPVPRPQPAPPAPAMAGEAAVAGTHQRVSYPGQDHPPGPAHTDTSSAPEDWLKPKIFKSSSLV